MKLFITGIIIGLACVGLALAQEQYLADVPEFNTMAMGAAVVLGGLGYALLRKK